jgi:ElaB/YqjD/DUF883 family membrane-anchored ribosome-binding protein
MTSTSKPIDQPPEKKNMADHQLPENSKENLDRKLDHAVKETFPTSDPVSVTITKGGAIDYDTPPASAETSQARPNVEHVVGQAKDTVRNLAESASDAARDAYAEGKRYVRRAQETYPQAEQYYRDGSRAVGQQVSENPLLSVLVAGAIGYALAWMIHGSSRRADRRVPEYGRNRPRYTEDQRAGRR